MAERKCKKCSGKTNNASGICSSCRIDMEFEELNTPWVKRRNIVTAEVKKEETVGSKKQCNCGRAVQKEGLCFKCFKAKYGHAPYPGQESKSKRPAKKGTDVQSVSINKHDSNNAFLVSQVYLDARSALQNLGYKKTMAENALASIQDAQSLSLDEVIKQTLKMIGNPKGLITPPPPKKSEVNKSSLPSAPMSGNNGTYIIEVNFTRYPKLHEKLIERADNEIREPGAQLMYMLRETLQGLEERA